jgi:endo-1,4-beta-xylanase
MPVSPYSSPELQARIEAGIRAHRMREAVIRVVDPAGRPVPGVTVEVAQVSADFLFGANLFMLGGYPSDELNDRYADAFMGLCNAATVPFYWRDLEPAPGQLRFTADAPPIPRRPPPDTVVAFCEEHGLTMNGHCLIWDYVPWSIPPWVEDTANCAPLLERRIRQIAQRYGDRIPRWDVLNEPLSTRNLPENRPQICPMPPDYERLAFEWAAQYLPESAHLMINETTPTSWYPELRASYLELIERLRADGAKIDGLGLQWHLFNTDDVPRVLAGELLPPDEMLRALDDYERLGLPVHISEITLPSGDNSPAGQAMQARLARELYRLWFSHPAVQAITWWNMPDGGGATGFEAGLASGLLNRDLSPKPAYEALHHLIRDEWRTRLILITDANGEAGFCGFHGDYCLHAQGQTHTVELRPAPSAAHLLLKPVEEPAKGGTLARTLTHAPENQSTKQCQQDAAD